ncbi:MAG TPA: PKD domain-containing protein [Candidatus Thermoplasmatota archaeon]|nr:PKD domain-containing protein [Candidatus Thermoplasmatota archaeon]
MGRQLLFPLLAAGIALLAFVALAPAATAEEVPATIQGSYFLPDRMTVTAGDTVTWTNYDAYPHKVAVEGTSDATGTLGQDASGSLTFPNVGTYTIRCPFHSNMKATIEVVAPAHEPTGPNEPPTITDVSITLDGMTVHLTATGTDPEGAPLAYGWNYGDGNATQYTEAANQCVSHTYAKAGTYKITLYLSDGPNYVHENRIVTVGSPVTGGDDGGNTPTTASPTPTTTTAASTATPTPTIAPGPTTATTQAPATGATTPTTTAQPSTSGNTTQPEGEVPGVGALAVLALAAVAALAYRRRS